MFFSLQINTMKIIISIFFIQFLLGESNLDDNSNSTTSLFSDLKEIEQKSLEIHQSILDAINNDNYKDNVNMLIQIYDIHKKNSLQMNQLLTYTLGKIDDKKVIPILMEIAQDNKTPLSIRNSAIEILSNKQAPELIDFFVQMIGDPNSMDNVNKFSLDIMGDVSEERMIMAVLEAYQLGRNKYFSLLNTIMNGLENFENSNVPAVYKEIARTKDFPSNIRLKAFKALAKFSEMPESADEIIELLQDPSNYTYYQEIISILKEYDIYDNYKIKLRHAAFIAMQKDIAMFKNE